MIDESQYKDLYRDFLKSELLDIAEQLEIQIPGETTTKVLVNKIMSDILENGVPEVEECTDLVLEFLVAAEICDENGNIIDSIEEGSAAIPSDVVEEVEAEMPPCYGWEDDRDPACNKCKVQAACRELRIRKRPMCFGKLFDANDENCKVCIEAPFCLEKMTLLAKELKKGIS